MSKSLVPFSHQILLTSQFIMLNTSEVITNTINGQHVFKMLTLLNLTASMWPQPAMVKDGDSFDFVIVGGGTAGCIIASNLVKLNMSVLVVEAGGIPPYETRFSQLFPLLQNTDYDWNFTSIRNETIMRYHKDKRAHIQQGKVLGGSGIVNYMFYDVGYPRDYDNWAKLTNDNRWSYKNLLPLIRKTEKVINKEILNSHDVKYHGTKGSLVIKKYYPKENNILFNAYKQMGYPAVNDINPENPIGFTNSYFTIGKQGRVSTATAFLSPEKNNPFLKVMYHSLAIKLIFDNNKRVNGVQILKQDKKRITVKAKKEVIITAGPIKSPHLLMLSGIGPKRHLQSKKIKVISDLPVGQNLIDNPTSFLVFKMQEAQPMAPLDPDEFPVKVIQGQVAVNKHQNYADYQTLNAYMDPSSFLGICGFVFTFENELCDRYYKGAMNRQLNFCTHSLLYPDSRGQILLNSTNPEDHPIIDPRYYCNSKDLDRHAKYLKHFYSVVKTKYFKSIKADAVDPKLETCCGLQRDTDAYWRCYAKSTLTSLLSHTGTCALGSVVDSRLRVKGVKNLRVADASVIPNPIGAKSSATIMIIAQQLTDLLVEEYSLSS